MVRQFRIISSLLVSSAIIISGCTTVDAPTTEVSFASKMWGNFVSYFNGYYNAQKEYQKAMKLAYQESLKSGNEISSVFPVIKKGSVGNKELTTAVNKSTAILQNHPESDLADDVLILIGKSYFYLGDLPPAERKFNEVISNYPNSPSIFEASLFLARTYIEQNKIDNALLILNELISRDDVPDVVKGEANLIIGERYYSAGSYDLAKKYLETGAELFDDQEAVARAYYLLGKANAFTENYILALSNLDEARGKSDLTATWYWSGVLKIRVYLMMKNYDLAQSTLDNLMDDDDLLGYKKNLTIEQARIYLSNENYIVAENLLKQFIIDNINSPLSTQAYYELGMLRKSRLNPNFEIARYFFEQAGKGGGGDSLTLMARREETTLKNYILSFLELNDLKNKVAMGIQLPDTATIPSVVNTPSEIIGDELPYSEKIDTEKPLKVNTQKKNNTTPNLKSGAVPQQKTSQPVRMNDEESVESVQSKTAITTDITLTDEEVLTKSLRSSYQSKYQPAKDSLSFVRLNESLIGSFEKIIEYFYFQTTQYDSAIVYINEFEKLFPDSPKLPRLVYAKYNALNLLGRRDQAEIVLNQISANYSKTKFGSEANKILGKTDSTSLVQNQINEKYNQAVALLDKNEVALSKKILTELSSVDTTNVMYPKILFALGYISEKYDKNWLIASSYYTRVQKSYPTSPISAELKKQFEIERIAVVASAEPNQSKDSAKENQNENLPDSAVKKGKKELTKFVITPNLPPRFKRQPKLADLSW